MSSINTLKSRWQRRWCSALDFSKLCNKISRSRVQNIILSLIRISIHALSSMSFIDDDKTKVKSSVVTSPVIKCRKAAENIESAHLHPGNTLYLSTAIRKLPIANFSWSGDWLPKDALLKQGAFWISHYYLIIYSRIMGVRCFSF